LGGGPNDPSNRGKLRATFRYFCEADYDVQRETSRIRGGEERVG